MPPQTVLPLDVCLAEFAVGGVCLVIHLFVEAVRVRLAGASLPSALPELPAGLRSALGAAWQHGNRRRGIALLILHVLGSWMALQAMVSLSVPFLQTVKATEPIMACALSWQLSPHSLSTTRLLAVFGLALGECGTHCWVSFSFRA